MKKRSERSRWVTVYTLNRPHESNAASVAVAQHEKAIAVFAAFEKVGRVVRVEVGKYNNELVFKARRA